MMFLVDAHCHLNREYYPDGLADVFARAAGNEVKRMLIAFFILCLRSFYSCPASPGTFQLMLLRLRASVVVLCSSADVVG